MTNAAKRLSIHQLSLYNTGRMSPEQVVAAFAARQQQFDRILADIAAEKPKSRAQHHLIVGQRGMGKTMLLARLAAELRIDSGLAARFIPLVFAEEQYAVDRLSKFWLNCLDSLADARELARDTRAVAAIDATVERLKAGEMTAAKDDQPFADEVYEAFAEAAKASGQRPVLLVDNLQLVFERLEPGQQHSLRELLMRPGSPILVGASPSPPPQSQDYGAAFYDHFKVHYLRPLDEAEMRALLVHLADVAERPDVRQRVLEHPQRLTILRQLTGGNPRTTLTLFFLYAEDFAPTVFGDLEGLLDRVTPLYKARFEELTAQQQVVASAVANHWDPVTAAALVRMTGLPAGTISSQLDRLEKVGFVERTELFGETRTGYQIAERFFNIWFLMRSASRRQRREVEFLTRFLEHFYEPAERDRLARQLMLEERFSPDRYVLSHAVAATLSEREMAEELTRHADLSALLENECEVRARLRDLIDFDSLPPATLAFDELRRKLVALVPERSPVQPEAFAKAVLGDRKMFASTSRERLAGRSATLTAEEIESVLASVQETRAADEQKFGREAVEWFSHRLATGQLRTPRDAEDWNRAFRQVEGRATILIMLETFPDGFGRSLTEATVAKITDALAPDEDADAEAWREWGYINRAKLTRYAEAEVAYRAAVARDATSVKAWTGLGHVLNGLAPRFEEAEAAYRKAIELQPTYAGAWVGLAETLLDGFGNIEAAEIAFRTALSHDDTNLRAWIGLGNLLYRDASRLAEAESAYRAAIEKDPASAPAYNNLGNLLWRMKRLEEAEAAFRMAAELYTYYAQPWVGLGHLLFYDSPRFEEAAAAYRKGLALDPNNATVWSSLGDLLRSRLLRFEEAEVAYRSAIALDADSAATWTGLAHLLQDHLGRLDEAEAAYRRVLAAHPTYSWAWSGLGGLHSRRGEYEQAERAYRQALEHHEDNVDGWVGLGHVMINRDEIEEADRVYRKAIAIDPMSAWAHHGLGIVYYRRKQYPDAEASLRTAISFGPPIAESWWYLGMILRNADRFDEAEAAYRHALSVNANYVRAWRALGSMLADMPGRWDDAEGALRKAAALNPADEVTWNALGNLYCDHLHRPSDAADAYDRALALDPTDESVLQNRVFLRRDFMGEGASARPLFDEVRRASLKFMDTLHLQEALFAAYDANWGIAREALQQALDLCSDGFPSSTLDDWLRATAVLLHLNYGSELLSLVVERGDSGRLRPWVEALRALVAGDRRALQNVAPEIRVTAERLYDGIQRRLEKLPEKTRRRALPAASGKKSRAKRRG